jgi:acyl-coenzyme A synthetase/AMP-(fatty) acid ligase
MVERRGERYFFLGRKSGLINVGGAKVYPEEIEAIINTHPAVRMSRVYAQRSSITGSLVAADIVLKESPHIEAPYGDAAARRAEIVQLCRDRLDAYKVPATIRFVSSLDVEAGKVVRRS